MLRNTLFATVMLSALPLAGASARYVELAAAARDPMLVEVRTTPGAAEAARPWISEAPRLHAVATLPRRRPRFFFTPPRD